MAQSQATVRAGVFSREDTLTATADADNAATTWNHGLPAAPDVVILTSILASTTAVAGSWSVTTISATQIGCTKNSTAAGSGNASPQVRVQAILHHSIQR